MYISISISKSIFMSISLSLYIYWTEKLVTVLSAAGGGAVE